MGMNTKKCLKPFVTICQDVRASKCEHKYLKPPPRTQWVTVTPRVPTFPSAHSSLLCTITQLLSLRLTQVTYGWKTWPSNHFKDPGTVTMRLAAAVTPSNIHTVLSYHVGIDGWSRLLWFVHCMASTQRVALGIFWLFKTSLAWTYVIFSLQAFHQVLGSTSTIIVSFWSVCLRFFWVPPSAALFSCWFTLQGTCDDQETQRLDPLGS